MPAVERVDYVIYVCREHDESLGSIFGVAALDGEDETLAAVREWLYSWSRSGDYQEIVFPVWYSGMPGMYMLIHFSPGARKLAEEFAARFVPGSTDLGRLLIDKAIAAAKHRG